jgi:hypothetical protein
MDSAHADRVLVPLKEGAYAVSGPKEPDSSPENSPH